MHRPATTGERGLKGATSLACPTDWQPVDENDDRQRCYGSANHNSFFGAGMVNAARAAGL
jgi:hypothetical protein